MAKKGNMNISNDDFEFDDELFPLDDSVYDDDDDLAGFSFNPNDTEEKGAKGFFKNTMKSVKGLGVDFVDEFLPEAASLTDDIKSSISDAKDAFVDKKDKLISSIEEFKNNRNKKSASESKEEVKSGFSKVFDNIKHGKFYKSNRDVTIDMNDFLGDDEEDKEVSENQEEQDTSGVMTTSFDYRSPRKRKNNKLVISNNNDENLEAIGEMQEASTIAIASINSKLANAQIHNTNQNYFETLKLLNNIDENIYGIGDFLRHYGKTNIDAQLEYDSKSLAFLTDQRALLKDILKANNAAIGIREVSNEDVTDEDKERDKKRLFNFGSFDMSKYLGNVTENAKNMLLGSGAGQVYEMGMGLKDMMGKDSGIKMDPSQLASSLIKSTIFNNLIGSNTKNKLERLNDLYGNIGGTLVSKFNNLKDSDNSALSFLGSLLGTDVGMDKSINLNKEDLSMQSPLDVKTKESINEVIPGYLAQIVSALTGEKLTYFNHVSKQFETQESIEQKYKQSQNNVIEGNINFSRGINFIDNGIMSLNKDGKYLEKNGYKELTNETLKKSIDTFKENILESKAAIDPYRLQKDPEYRDKMFRGIKSIDENNYNQIVSMIISKLSEMQNIDYGRQLTDFNNSIFKTSEEVEKQAQDFKTNFAKIGGLTAIAKLNDSERWKALDYDMEYSGQYNEDKAGKNEFAKERARINRANIKKSEFMERIGKIDYDLKLDETGLSSNSYNVANKIYDLLLNGVKVFPITDGSEYDNRLKEINEKINNKLLYEDEQKEKEDKKNKDLELLRDVNGKEAKKIAEEMKKRKLSNRYIGAQDDSLIGQIRQSLGFDRIANSIADIASKPMEALIGKGTTDAYLDRGGFDQEDLENAKEYAKNKKEHAKELAKSFTQIGSKKKGKKENIFKITGEKIATKTEILTTKLREHNAENEEKRIKNELKKQEETEKHGSYMDKLMGFETSAKIHNASLNMSGMKRSIVYVDPDYIANLSEKSDLKFKLLNLLKRNNAEISFNLDESVDYAFAGKLSEDDKKIVNKNKIVYIKASDKNLKELDGRLKNSEFNTQGNLSRSLNAQIESNNNIVDYKERDENLNRASVVKFNINERVETNKNKKQKESNRKAVTDAKNEYKSFLKDNEKYYNKNGEKLFDENNLNESELKKVQELEELRKNLISKINKTSRDEKDYNESEGSSVYKYKLLSQINDPKSAGSMFLKPNIEKEIDELLNSGDEKAILEFASKIQGKNESLNSSKEKMKYLDPEFADRMNSFISDPRLLGKGVSIKESSRSPLFQFALYSKGRVDPKITGELMNYAGFGKTPDEGLAYFDKAIRTKMGSDGITARSLKSNHLTGRAVDINNGSIGFNKLAKIASEYGIKWAGEKDKPHFEFDPNFKMGPMTEKEAGKINSKFKTSMISTSNIKEASDNEETKISGKPISYFQNDPVDTVVSGSLFGEVVTKEPKTDKELLRAIYVNTTRIANNTESIGFGLGIPGEKGKGLFGKIGSTAKDLVGKTIDLGKKGFEKGKNAFSTLFTKGKEIINGNTNTIEENDKTIIINGKIEKDKLIESIKKYLKDHNELPKFIKINGVEVNSDDIIDVSVDKSTNTKKISISDNKFNKLKDKVLKQKEKIEVMTSKLNENRKSFIDNISDKFKDIFEKGKDGISKITNKGKEIINGKSTINEEELSKLTKDEIINKYNLASILNMDEENIKKKYKKEDLIKLVKENNKSSGLLEKGKNLVSRATGALSKATGGLIKTGTNLTESVINTGKNILFGSNKINRNDIIKFLKDKNPELKEKTIKNMSDEDLLKCAKDLGYQESNKGLVGKALDFGKSAIGGITGSLFSGSKINKKSSNAIIDKLDEIIDAIYDVTGKKRSVHIKKDEKIKENKTKENKKSLFGKTKDRISDFGSKIKSKLSSIKDNNKDKKSLSIIRNYGLEERLNISEDKILEIYTYTDLQKFKTAIDRENKSNNKKDKEKVTASELLSKSKSKLSDVAAAAGDKASNAISKKIIKKYNLTEYLDSSEDEILECITTKELLDYDKTQNIEKLKKFKEKINKFINKGKETVKKTGKKISDTSSKVFNNGKNFIKSKFLDTMTSEQIIEKYNLEEDLDASAEEIAKVFTQKELVDYIKDQKKEKREKMILKIKSGIGKGLTAAKNGITTIGGALFKGGKSIISKGLDIGGKVFKNMPSTLSKGFNFGKNILSSGLKAGKDILSSGLDFGKNIFGGALNGIKGLFGKLGFNSNFNEILLNKLETIDSHIISGFKLNDNTSSFNNFNFENINEPTLASSLNTNSPRQINTMKPLLLENKSDSNNVIDNVEYTIQDEPSTASLNTNSPRQIGVSKPLLLEYKNDNNVEGSYNDQKADKERKEQIDREILQTKSLASIAAVLGTTESAVAASHESVKPEPNLASMIMANYQNSEKEQGLLEEIKDKSGEGNGSNKSGALNKFSKLGTAGGKLAAGIQTAGGIATIGAAAAGAAMIGKQAFNKIKADKADFGNSTSGEKISKLFGGGGSSNYDNNGNKITDKDVKAGNGFGLGQAVHVATFAKGVSKIPAIFSKFSGFIAKIFKDPKIVAKLGGKAAAESVSKAFTKAMEKSLSKGAAKIVAKVSEKIASFCAKISNFVGWGIMIAQLVYDIGTGMAEAPRYFKMGKGMKPTWAMRITAGLAKALSGNLTFGLIPPEAIATLIFNVIGNKATKDQMKSAEEFDKSRANIMEVEYDRLVEFETMTWTEMFFGGDKKRATILGFMKGKNDKDGCERFKTWFDKVYEPLDNLYKSMVKEYGGKVNKKIDPKDLDELDNQEEFRKNYIEAAKNYIKNNKLEGLGPLGKVKSEDEKSEAEFHKDETNTEEKENTETIDKINEEESSGEESKISTTMEDTKSNGGDGKAEVEQLSKDLGGDDSTATIHNDNDKITVSSDTPTVTKPDNTNTSGNDNTGDNSRKTTVEPSKPEINSDEDKSSGAENAQADGINFKKLNDSKYIQVWSNYAKDNLNKTNMLNAMTNARSGIGNKTSKLGSAIKSIGGKMSSGFKKVKEITSNLIGNTKEKVSNVFGQLKSPVDAIAQFVSDRKNSETKLSSLFNSKEGENEVLNLQKRIVDKNALGQQKSTATLSPEFTERVQAMLKDKRVQNHGVSVREGYRSPATQLAYYSKGRAPNALTDMLMKIAGFKEGINFWDKSFQKPGDYVTWTLASNHFNGSAVDMEPGDLGYDKLGAIAKEYGIDWGGYWTTPDKPHFEMGDPDWKMPTAVASSGSTTEAELAQADTINYDKMLSKANKAKAKISSKTSDIIGSVSKKTNSIASNAKNYIYNKQTKIKNDNKNNANLSNDSFVTSNLIANKFDELLKTSTEGVDIMRELLNETKRHNKSEEEMLSNILKGIGALGAIFAAAQNNGYSSAGSTNSITKGIFDNLAKGI